MRDSWRHALNNKRLVNTIGVLSVLLGLFGTRELWLTQLGRFLVVEDQLRRADVVVVPSTEFLSEEPAALSHAARLIRAGYASRVIVDEGIPFYGRTSCEFWIPRVSERTGIDPKAFECVQSRSEAISARMQAVISVLERRGVRRAILVNPGFSSRLNKRVFRDWSSHIETLSSLPPGGDYDPLHWWSSMAGIKTFVGGLLNFAFAG